MKKKILLGILSVVFLLTACKEDKMIVTIYTTGCIGYSTSAESHTQWHEIDLYMGEHIDSYNKEINFESPTVAENDTKAIKFIEDQMKKIDEGKVCSYIDTPDQYIYGIKKRKVDGSYKVVKAYRFESGGVSEYID